MCPHNARRQDQLLLNVDICPFSFCTNIWTSECLMQCPPMLYSSSLPALRHKWKSFGSSLAAERDQRSTSEPIAVSHRHPVMGWPLIEGLRPRCRAQRPPNRDLRRRQALFLLGSTTVFCQTGTVDCFTWRRVCNSICASLSSSHRKANLGKSPRLCEGGRDGPTRESAQAPIAGYSERKRPQSDLEFQEFQP